MEKKILVVDDDEGFLDELSEALSMRGFQIIEVDDPCAALEVAEKQTLTLSFLISRCRRNPGSSLPMSLRTSKNFPVSRLSPCRGFLKINIPICLRPAALEPVLRNLLT